MGVNFQPQKLSGAEAVINDKTLRSQFTARSEQATRSEHFEPRPQIAHNWGFYAGYKAPKTPRSKFKHDVLRGKYSVT